MIRSKKFLKKEKNKSKLGALKAKSSIGNQRIVKKSKKFPLFVEFYKKNK